MSSQHLGNSWRFAIDVGGTFTDCIAVDPQGDIHRCKTLSSGVVKGAVGKESTGDSIIDPARIGDAPEFWNGWRLTLFDNTGKLIGESTVNHFECNSGQFQLRDSLTKELPPGASYELHCSAPAPIVAIRRLLGLKLADAIPPASIRLGTTRGTNALLTRQGARTALVTTQGFGDLLEIGYQNRPHLFQLAIEKPAPLYAASVEIEERIFADGSIDVPLNEANVRDQLASLKSQSIDSLAICLINGYANGLHEKRIGEIAAEIGFANISLSHEVTPTIKAVSRGDTTVVDAYLNPVLASYVQSIRNAAPQTDLKLLTSAGGLADPDFFSGKDSILSGPAGGVVGFAAAAKATGFTRSIGFDMGGTSTDVARHAGEFEYEYETEKGGVRIVAPMMAIETVAAGGGSVCRFDGVKLIVGPESAGADPGPACYGKGGPLTVTDCNVFLKRIAIDHFPFPLDQNAVAKRLQAIADEMQQTAATDYSPQQIAEGFIRVANAKMAKAIRSISVARGFDPRDHLLVGFGGAAPQHACAVADELGMTSILLHPDGGILSAVGMSLAKLTEHAQRGVYRPLTEYQTDLEQAFAALEAATRDRLVSQGTPPADITTLRRLDLRYTGADSPLTISATTAGNLADAFHREHERIFGYRQEAREIEVAAIRVESFAKAVRNLPESKLVASSNPPPAPSYQRSDLQPGAVVTGPCLVIDAFSTIVIDAHWQGNVLSAGELLLKRVANSGSTVETADAAGETEIASEPADPVELELFNNALAGIAEQMGVALRRTASSVNVKERLDFSCAIFSPRGEMVVNAPHIPVHLGAMSETVKGVLADNPDLAPGDVIVTNDPYRGGSHLPDITVVTPVFAEEGKLLFLTASRAHHAEIGGVRPGSMPPFSKNLAEEGVLIGNFKLIDAGVSRHGALLDMLRSAEFPSRDPAANLADINAQVAANRMGAAALLAFCNTKGLAYVQSYMRHIQTAAETKMRQALQRLAEGRREFSDALDDGSKVCVAVTIKGDAAMIDFTGSADVHPGNFNANRAIVTAAVMYVLRCLIDEEIPLNEGVLAPIELILPAGMLNPSAGDSPRHSPAVVAGNVETSQRVVDVLLAAFELAAASQGTMNNLLFGDATFGYYETICGGVGATATSPGTAAVQTHMTNTRLTDPEVLEQRYPAMVRSFAVRKGSGGDGRFNGGDGVVRTIEFLASLEVSLLTSRRGAYPPFGLHAGQPGKIGRNQLQRASGETVLLSGCEAFSVEAGDQLMIETPGGGGFGEAQ